MSAESLRYRLRPMGLDAPSGWVALALAGLFTYVLAATVTGVAPVGFLFLLPPVAIIAALCLLLRRRVGNPAWGIAVGWIGILAAGIGGGAMVVVAPYVVVAIPAVLISAVVTSRYPVPSVLAVFLISGAFGSSQAFLHLSPAPVADILMGGLWLGTIWSYLFAVRDRPVWLWPGVVVMGFYFLLSFAETVARGDEAALQSFRGATWYMASFLLIAFAPWSRDRAQQLATGVVAIACLVGGYATFRWVFGQSGTELANALAQSDNNVVNGETRLIGSFITGKELAAWTAVCIPFCLAYALTFTDRRRLLGLAACATCAVGMLGSDVRVGVVAVVPAVFLVLVLYQVSTAFPGVRFATTIAIGALVAALGVGAFAFTLGGKSDTSSRYSILLRAPTQDPSYQARLFKWRDALDDIGHHPLGQGLGTSGRSQKRYGRYLNISTFDVDNSYLKIALEQGFVVLLLYVVGYALLLFGLARRAVFGLREVEAGLAIGAAGVLVVFAIFLFAGTYIEGLTALTAWVLVGIGAAATVQGDRRRAEDQDDATAERTAAISRSRNAEALHASA